MIPSTAAKRTFRSNYTAGFGHALSAILNTEATATANTNSHIQSNTLNGLARQAHQYHAVTHHVRGKQFEYRDLIKDHFFKQFWFAFGAIELGPLAQGFPFCNVKSIDTIFFIHKHQVPHSRTVAYVRICWKGIGRDVVAGRGRRGLKGVQLQDGDQKGRCVAGRYLGWSCWKRI